METTKTNNTEVLIESAKVMEKWFNDTREAMMNIYNKQLNLTSGFYTNLLNSTSGNYKGWNESKGFADLFSNSAADPAKWLWMPFSNNGNTFSNPFITTFNKSMKQMQEYNQSILSAFGIDGKGKEANWTLLNKEYMETIEKRLEASRRIFSSMVDSYSKEMDFSAETNKKLMEEINDQLNDVMKQNQKFWADALKMSQISLNGEDKKTRETSLTEIKKRPGVQVVA